MPRKKKRTITYSFVAEILITIDIPEDFSLDTSDWDDEQWSELLEKAEDEVCKEEAEWNLSFDNPTID